MKCYFFSCICQYQRIAQRRSMTWCVSAGRGMNQIGPISERFTSSCRERISATHQMWIDVACILQTVCNLTALWGRMEVYLDVVWMTSSELLVFKFVKHKLKFTYVITMVFLIAISVESYKLNFLHATIYPIYKSFHYDYKNISCSLPHVKNGTGSHTYTILNVFSSGKWNHINPFSSLTNFT